MWECEGAEYIDDRKKRNYKLGRSWASKRPFTHAEKSEDQWINQGRRGYRSVTSKVIQSILLCRAFPLYTSTSVYSQRLKLLLGIQPKK